jgi:phage terminase large subunit-like protein
LTADGATMIPMGQGFASMSAPTKELEKLILSGDLRHGGHPVLRWNAGNVAVEQDAAGNLKPSKKKSTEKIDGIVALVMAIDRATRNDAGISSYDADGAEIFAW